jgi:alpha-beta hydrolase superfamily lysophospholipase
MSSDLAGYESVSVVADDGYRLLGRRYAARGDARAVVCCFHGIQSHAGWYEASCRYLAERGCEVTFWDRRGSGANLPDRGHADSPTRLIDDLACCVEAAKQARPGSPSVVIGISWGGKLASVALGERPELADGLILAAPGLAAKVGPGLRAKAAIVWSHFLRPRRLLPIPLADPALFTPNPERQRFIAEDVLSLRRASARLLFASRLLDRRLRAVAPRVRTPALLILATEDRIVDNAKTRRIFDGFGSADKEVVAIAGGHTMEFDPEPRAYFQAMYEWLDRRIHARTP